MAGVDGARRRGRLYLGGRAPNLPPASCPALRRSPRPLGPKPFLAGASPSVLASPPRAPMAAVPGAATGARYRPGSRRRGRRASRGPGRRVRLRAPAAHVSTFSARGSRVDRERAAGRARWSPLRGALGQGHPRADAAVRAARAQCARGRRAGCARGAAEREATESRPERTARLGDGMAAGAAHCSDAHGRPVPAAFRGRTEEDQERASRLSRSRKAGTRSRAVVLEAIIASSGCIEAVEVQQSPDPRLSVAALVAVSRWRYTPTLLDGRPVPVIMHVTANFRLS
jgi:Gram-negative bacterial TonB protein C-terminal